LPKGFNIIRHVKIVTIGSRFKIESNNRLNFAEGSLNAS